jgi:hypothetical protein
VAHPSYYPMSTGGSVPGVRGPGLGAGHSGLLHGVVLSSISTGTTLVFLVFSIEPFLFSSAV